MTLWEKDNTEVSARIREFTVGRDTEFDLLLAPYDVKGSIAHVTMLGSVKLLSQQECDQLVAALNELLIDIESGTFSIPEGTEDIHSCVEMLLTAKLGDTGKKIHTGRSRNDQVAVDIKMYLRDELMELRQLVLDLFDLLIVLSSRYKEQLMPGYTHYQLAMPSSFGLWFGSLAESLADDMALMGAAYYVANKNPLGSGAGYGSSFPLDRKLTTELLGFGDLHYNSMYAQVSRGKTERVVAQAMSNVAATLGKLSSDICLFMNQNFGFLSFPPELTTGSSIMPHKKNPDVLELTRAKCNRIQALPNEVTLLGVNLPSGYHRDMQLTKEILFPALKELKDCIEMVCLMLKNVSVKPGLLDDPKYLHLFTVERINDLVTNGMTFRDAYRQVGNEVEQGIFNYIPGQLHHTHEGSIGNLCLDEIRACMTENANWRS